MTAMPDKLEPDAETGATADVEARPRKPARMRRASLAALLVAALGVSLLMFFDSRA